MKSRGREISGSRVIFTLLLILSLGHLGMAQTSGSWPCRFLEANIGSGDAVTTDNTGLTIIAGEEKEAIELFSSSPVQVFPNPAEDWVTVEAREQGVEVVEVKVLDLTGRSMSLPMISQPESVKVNMAGTRKGVYTFIVKLSNGFVATEKVISQ